MSRQLVKGGGSGREGALAAAWGKALSLDERLAATAGVEAGRVDRSRGERRLTRWHAQPPFDTNDYFELRLAQSSISRERLADLLGETWEPGAEPAVRPDWVTRLERSYADAATSAGRLELPSRWQQALSRDFWDLVEPLVRGVHAEVVRHARELCRRHPNAPLRSDDVKRALSGSLPFELLDWPLRTLVLELNIARLRGDLVGVDAHERFQHFAARLRDPEVALALLAEYPVLARQLLECVEAWGRNTQEILERLCHDWPLVRERVPGAELAGTLTDLRGGAGDRHRGGRSVAMLGFSSGFRLIYKPRSLAMDAGFQKLLQTLGEWGASPSFRPIEVIDRGTHGWMEHVSSGDCASNEGVRRFYVRQGGFLALFHALCATDLHFENVIAAGEHPVVVDLESILQPGAPHDDPLADDVLYETVVRIGLLPVRVWENESSPGLDVSGLGGMDGQLPPRPQPIWARQATDEMHFAREIRPIEMRSNHRPKLAGVAMLAEDHVEDILDGFTRTYRLLLARRADLLAHDGPLSHFADGEVRVLLRPTAVYGLMLRESFHPDFLRDGLDRERFFDKLWTQVPKRPFLRRVIAAEQRALQQGDVPLFTTRPDSRRLWSSDGEILDDFFTESAMELIERRLGGFGARDQRNQQWLIRASIAIVSSQEPARDARRRSVPQPGRPSPELRPSLLRLAAAIGDQLAESAIEDGESVQWLSLVPGRQGLYKIDAVGTDLYAGLSGVTLFLAHLGHLTGDAAANRLAEKSCYTLLRRLGDEAGVAGAIGAFEGTAGAVYTLSHLAALWSRPALLDDALRLALPLADRIADDEALDVINGSAGCALALATLQRLRPSQELLAILESCGERLVDRAVETPEGVGWRTTGESEEPMTGFSHGVSGIAAALFELWALSGREAFRDVARQGLVYEASLFSAEHGNWPDLRVEINRFDQINWCHGAPGIGLARTLVVRHQDTAEVRAELDAAVSTTLARGFGRNHSLCHGDLGNVDLLLEANALRPAPRLQTEIDRLAAEIAADVESGWRCGLPMPVETPGLMTGLAGIGYGLLRLAAPNRVPSVLALKPPMAERRAISRLARRKIQG